MIQLFQVGVGSGGMVVLDLLCRDERVRKITLIDPDVYQPHNVHRHYFPAASMGRFKVDLAAEWIGRFRSDIEIEALPLAVEAPESAVAAASATFGICAVDVESAKFRFDVLMRQHGKSWTMGEVLSGGIGVGCIVLCPAGPATVALPATCSVPWRRIAPPRRIMPTRRQQCLRRASRPRRPPST